MKLTYSNPLSPLQLTVWTMLQNLAEHYERLNALQPDLNQGCASGVVTSLVYYRDTLAFFESHKEEINTLLARYLAERGLAIPALFANWDITDPLALGTHNRNLLAWFAFEHIAADLLQQANVEEEDLTDNTDKS